MKSNVRLALAAKVLALFLATIGFFLAVGARSSTINARASVTQEKPATASAPQASKKLDPAAWGGNHVGKPVPEFLQGDECLFCHRYTIGATWQQNAHGVAIRQNEDAPEFVAMVKSEPKLKDFANQIEYYMGSRHRVRFLKKEGFGKFAILDSQATLNAEHKAIAWESVEKPAWNKDKFANSCTGCHNTGIDTATKTFSAFGIDCYACHGSVDLNHSNDTSLVLLSKKRRNDAKIVTSICAQCHLRESQSRSTGLPYPNNFVAGDNLFQDLVVNWTRAEEEKLNPGDRHIWRNARDVATGSDESITCLNCHQIHAVAGATPPTNPTLRHRRILRAPICSECHAADSFKNPKPYTVHSKLCEY